MDINNDVLSGLLLINSPQISEDDFKLVLDYCFRKLRQADDKVSSSLFDNLDVEKVVLVRILIFSVCSLVVEASKLKINDISLIRVMQEHNIDTSTSNFKLFATFLQTILKPLHNSFTKLDLDTAYRFLDLEWSQILRVKGSFLESTKERNYIIDLYADQANDYQKQSEVSVASKEAAPNQSVLSLSLTAMELQDLHSSLRDCVKSVASFISK